MRELLKEEIFSSVETVLAAAAEEIISSADRILLISEPSLYGALAIAPIEASLLDLGKPYRRRFTNEAPGSTPFLRILSLVETDDEILKTNPLRINIGNIVVDGLRGHLGDNRKGPLTVVAQMHALAQAIFPASHRLERMRPWLISGNWLDTALDTTYDPVYSSLRDLLLLEGTIRVAPITEVSEPDSENYPWLEKTILETARKKWNANGSEGKATILSKLAKPALRSSTPSSARLEELIWHCILSNNWKTDLVSQIMKASRMWEFEPDHIAAGLVTDSLLASGQI